MYMVTAVDLEEFCLRLLLAALTFIETHKTTNRASTAAHGGLRFTAEI
jgi:hypothetical protein